MIQGDALFQEPEREEASRIDQVGTQVFSVSYKPLTTILVDPHADLKQPRAVAIHEPLLNLARMRLTHSTAGVANTTSDS